MGLRLTLSLMVVGVFLALYIAFLGVRPLVIPDEARYAEIPREMLVSGDWVVPRLNGLRYFEKPPLGYWLNAGSIWLFGENAFAIRLPSAVAVGLTALLLFVWARRFTEDDVTPLLATVVFLLSFEVLAVGTFCVLDSLLSLFTTAAIVTCHFAYTARTTRTRMVLLALAGLTCGLAFLTKGFLALVVPTLVMVPFMLWEGRFKILLKSVWLPLGVAVLVALPWAVAIHRREPDFWHYFFWVEHINRFISPNGGQHPEPLWYYVPFLLVGAMPWTALAGPIAVGLRHANWNHPMIRLAICWLVLPFLFFSACGGKLGTYIVPCFPPLAFLIAVGLLKCLSEGDVKGFVVGMWVFMLGAAFLFLALVVALSTVPEMCDKVALWEWGIAGAGLVLWVVLCRAATTQARVHAKLAFCCAGPVLFMFSWHFISAAALSPEKAPGAFLRSRASGISRNGILVTENDLAGAVCWFYNRDDVFLTGRTGEYSYGLSYEDSQSRVLDVEQIKGLILGQARTEPVVLVVGSKCYGQYQGQLPRPCGEEKREDLVWAAYLPPGSLSGRDLANCASVPKQ